MKPIPNFENYFITEDGKVWSIYSNKYLVPQIKGHGYLGVTLYNNNKKKNCYIHRLVAEAYIPNPSNLPQVNHKDEDTTNNSVENLEWCDAHYNNNYGSHTAKLKKKIVCVETGIIYESIILASKLHGIGRENFRMALKDNNRTAGGYHWEFYNN